jgi:hypothetical protein
MYICNMINEDKIKENFVAICSMIFVGRNGFTFPFETIQHSVEYSDIYNSNDYPVLESKMKNLIKLVNEDNSMIEKDVETELWQLI